MAEKNYYRERKEKGVCIYCAARPGEVIIRDGVKKQLLRCKECAEKFSIQRKFARQNKICTTCGINPAEPARCSCKQCLIKQREQSKTRAKERLQASLCRQCGKNPHLPWRKHCQDCLDEMKIKNDMLNEHAKNSGLFKKCGEERSILARSPYYCDKCLDYMNSVRNDYNQRTGYRRKNYHELKKRSNFILLGRFRSSD